MHYSTAYFLVSHGSKDPRHAAAIEHLAQLLRQQLCDRPFKQPAIAQFTSPDRPLTVSDELPPLVGTAALELAPHPLHQQLQAFAECAHRSGYHQVKILPLFLLPGVHVMEDIPEEVAIAQTALGDRLKMTIQPYLGSHPQLADLFTLSQDSSPTTPRIILSHGSRRPGGNAPVEAIAQQLGAVAAYWSVSPSLETQITALVQQGCQTIAIVPYFLFKGGITDAIAQQVHHLSLQFPYVRLQLADPLGANPALAALSIELLGQ